MEFSLTKFQKVVKKKVFFVYVSVWGKNQELNFGNVKDAFRDLCRVVEQAVIFESLT